MARKPDLPPAPVKPAVKPPVPARTVTKFIEPWVSGVAGAVVGTVEHDPEQVYNFAHVHPKTQAIRRMFVAEFVKDFNAAAAIARLGLTYNDPATPHKWLKEPFTQYLLDRYVQESEQDALVTRNQVIAALVREANYHGLDGSAAARVSALGKLSKVLGMQIEKSEVDVRVAGGIMLIPIGATPDDWERNAKQAQIELKEEAKK